MNNPTSPGTPSYTIPQELIGNIAGVDALIEQTLTVTKEVVEVSRNKRLSNA